MAAPAPPAPAPPPPVKPKPAFLSKLPDIGPVSSVLPVRTAPPPAPPPPAAAAARPTTQLPHSLLKLPPVGVPPPIGRVPTAASTASGAGGGGGGAAGGGKEGGKSGRVGGGADDATVVLEHLAEATEREAMRQALYDLWYAAESAALDAAPLAPSLRQLPSYLRCLSPTGTQALAATMAGDDDDMGDDGAAARAIEQELAASATEAAKVVHGRVMAEERAAGAAAAADDGAPPLDLPSDRIATTVTFRGFLSGDGALNVRQRELHRANRILAGVYAGEIDS